MYFFEITNEEKKLLLLAFDHQKRKINFSITKDNILVVYDDISIENCFHCLLDEFLSIGLNQNDEPNQLGEEIEKLNSRINHILVLINSEKQYSNQNTTSYIRAKRIYFETNGMISASIHKQEYAKLKIPKWLEEKWQIDITNKKMEELYFYGG